MKWIGAMVLGAIIAVVLPMMLGGMDGLWLNSWTKTGTIRPVPNSPGLLFSIPVFIGASIIFRLFFSWHRD